MPKFYSATFLQSVTKPGRYRVDPGLYLSVSGTNGSAKTWMFRYQRHGHRHDAGLGAYPDVSVTEAKRLAVMARQQLGAGIDPIQERRAALRLVLPIPTFSEVADILMEQITRSDINEKNRYRAGLLLGPSYCGPILNKPVNAITVTDIADLLSAVAAKKPETSLKLLGQLRKLFQLARITLRDRNAVLLAPLPTDPEDLRAAGYRPSTTSLPHPALDWREAPELMGRLRTFPGLVSQALQVLILTGLRESAVVGAEWPEIDLKAGVWTVPLDRLKDRRHRSQALRVPISSLLHDLFVEMNCRDANWVFPGQVPGQHLAPQSLLQMLRPDRGGWDNRRLEAVTSSTTSFRGAS